jgi:dCTP deaminase
VTVLSDAELARIWPDSTPGPASIDLHLGDTLLYWPEWIRRDPRVDQSHLWCTWTAEDLHEPSGPIWVLQPGYRYLAATRERIRMPDDLAGQIDARSSWARDGLNVLAGPAGFIDPGFIGYVVLELSVIGSQLVLWPGASIAQLIVHRMERPARRPYSGKYQDQTGVTPSRHHVEVTG